MIGVGEAKTPESLRKVCNRFLLIENIVAGDEPVPAPVIGDRPKVERVEAVPVVLGIKRPAMEAIPLVVDAMRKIDADQDWYPLGQLGQFMTQLFPDFDSRSYGAPKLSDLLRKIPRFEVAQAPGGQLQVRDKA